MKTKVALAAWLIWSIFGMVMAVIGIAYSEGRLFLYLASFFFLLLNTVFVTYTAKTLIDDFRSGK